ncbi:MAG: HlyD family efflux transporter periplasmic adaptor subunit [Clostridiales bacterium]|nr:HlyD family efflux transporter periplasmic adaptor subunit [Clostridiales bacterium]
MKKYVMLLAFTLIAVGSIVFSGFAAKQSVIPVVAVKLESLTVENSVNCTGRVERIGTTTVYAARAARLNHIYVKEGDKVKAGDLLFTVLPVSSQDSVSAIPSGIPEKYKDLIDQYENESSAQGAEDTKPENIAAPVSGIITSLSVAKLGYVTEGSPLAVIADDSGLQVRLSVNESQMSDIKVGQKAVITGTGFKNQSYNGKVKSIAKEAKQITDVTGQETVVEVIVSVDHPGDVMKPGYTAKAKIITSQDQGVLIAPYEAVRADDNGSEYVFKVKGNRAVKTPVVTKNEFDSGFEVVKGLSDNDVIIQNPDHINNGAHIILSGSTAGGAVSSDD